jgi:hypothetical protein
VRGARIDEAKKTTVDPEVGRHQAKLYADGLEKMCGHRPVTFYTNGFDIWMWDEVQGFPPRKLYLDRIEVRPGQERGHCEVIIVGALAQILAFAQQKTTAASSGDGGTFLMVAGRGFEPLTFRL